MSFTRTAAGLGNQCLFYNVDAVVFTEGGEVSWSIDDIKRNNFNDRSIDIVYWRKLFDDFKSEINLKFKAVGSKSTVSAIAIEIRDNDLNTVIAAMDNEFDDLHGNQIDHPNILYTYGYSWENDVWNPRLIVSILENFSGEVVESNQVEESIESFKESIIEAVYADAMLFGQGASFLPRKGHLKCIECNVKESPTVIESFIDQLIVNKGVDRQTIQKYGIKNNIRGLKYCYGHLLNDFVFHLVRYISISILGIKAIHKELLERYAIKNFLSFCSSEVVDYYDKKIKNTVPNS